MAAGMEFEPHRILGTNQRRAGAYGGRGVLWAARSARVPARSGRDDYLVRRGLRGNLGLAGRICAPIRGISLAPNAQEWADNWPFGLRRRAAQRDCRQMRRMGGGEP